MNTNNGPVYWSQSETSFWFSLDARWRYVGGANVNWDRNVLFREINNTHVILLVNYSRQRYSVQLGERALARTVESGYGWGYVRGARPREIFLDPSSSNRTKPVFPVSFSQGLRLRPNNYEIRGLSGSRSDEIVELIVHEPPLILENL